MSGCGHPLKWCECVLGKGCNCEVAAVSLGESTLAVLNDVKYLVHNLESPGKNIEKWHCFCFNFHTAAEFTLMTDEFIYGARNYAWNLKDHIRILS